MELDTAKRSTNRATIRREMAAKLGVDLFEVAQPRDDVLSGALTEDIFAANLDQAVAGTAPAVYADAATFFANTYASAGLRSLLNEALGRVGGGRPTAAPLIRLETSLGGGKTHNLIALYHAARGGIDRLQAAEFMDPELLPSHPVKNVAVFVGTEAGATSFPTLNDIAANTLWGYLALQLGGVKAYEDVRKDDEALTAIGAPAIHKMLSGGPALILIDEIARYLAVAEGRGVVASTLADQTVAFLMALIEAVSSEENACVVITTTAVTDAFGKETSKLVAAIAELQSVIARKEHVLRPSEEADLPKILTRRLFANVSHGAAELTGRAYSKAASEAIARGGDLPQRMSSPGWAVDVEHAWPFHPDLITVLDKRLSTIPNFQRTRGALRLLARTVRLLWTVRPPETAAIHLDHVDLSDREIAEDLSSRLDKATLEPVIRADIASQPGRDRSHAEQVDQRMPAGTKYARRLATATYLYSLTRDVPGVPAPDLIGSVFAPGDDINLIVKALDELEKSAWYLHTDGRGYRFSVEPSLTKLIQEAERLVTASRVKKAATDILAGQFKDSALKVRRTWEDAKVPDRDDDAWLVLTHWDEFGAEHGVGSPAHPIPAHIHEIWSNAPAGGLREYRNRLVFLAPTAANHEPMLRTMQRHLALKDLAGSGDIVRALPEEKRKELLDESKKSDLLARIAVCNHVNLLYVPSPGGLDAIELDVVTQASVKPNQTDAVLERLAAMDKTLAAGDKPLDPGLIKTKLGTRLERALATQDLVRAFAQRTDLKLVLDKAQINSLVINGVRNGVWEYQDAQKGDLGWLTKDRGNLSVRLADDTFICPLGTAPPPPKIGLIIPPPVPSPGSQAGTFHAEGNAGIALKQACERASEAGRQTIRTIEINVDEIGSGMATVLAKLHSVVGTAGGTTILYRVRTQVDLGDAAHSLTVDFIGPSSEYQALKPALEHVLRQHQATLTASVRADFEPALRLTAEAVEVLLTRAADTGPAKCRVTLITEEAS
jgi:Protein of unknown function (DUF499)